MNYDTAVILFLISALGHAVKSLMAIVVFKQVEGLHKASGLVKVFDFFCRMKIARDTPFCKNHDVKSLNIRQNFLAKC